MNAPDETPRFFPNAKEKDPRTQAEKFADLVRELECDESEEGFDDRLRRVAMVPKAAEGDRAQ